MQRGLGELGTTPGGLDRRQQEGKARLDAANGRGGKGMAGKRVARFAFWYGLWLVLAGWSPANAAAGIPAAALAAWAGGVLLPAGGRRLLLVRVVRYAAGFVWQSVVAGVDVAWRVFQPRMSLCPGFVRVAPRLPAGPARLMFRGIASLQPGSLACGVDQQGYLIFHCLDTREDVEGALLRAQDELANLWEEETE